MASQCQETAGFLISAPCKRKATSKCKRCGKPICDVHGRDLNVRAGKSCISCYRKSGAKYDSDSDDPYLFSGYYYHDYYTYSSYDSDWSDSGGAFVNNDDDGDWESDFDGS